MHTARVPAPHNHSQHKQCRTPHAAVHTLVLLMMGIMMPETCWDKSLIINIRLVAFCWFLSLHPTFVMHGTKSLKCDSLFWNYDCGEHLVGWCCQQTKFHSVLIHRYSEKMNQLPFCKEFLYTSVTLPESDCLERNSGLVECWGFKIHLVNVLAALGIAGFGNELNCQNNHTFPFYSCFWLIEDII